ncbi:MAG: hypothetical protein KF686_08200 [Ramlibacter sp.]|nr:hypothetical protein [Ramlibacter sp.]
MKAPRLLHLGGLISPAAEVKGVAATEPVAASTVVQHDLLVTLEARLTDEVVHLAEALRVFAVATQEIGEELPSEAQLGKHITLFFSAAGFHLAETLLKRRDVPLLVDDGAQQLREMGLSLDELIRELDLDGRRFLAVAFPIKPDPEPMA